MVTIPAKHKGSRDANREVKEQVSGNAPIWLVNVVKHLDIGRG